MNEGRSTAKVTQDENGVFDFQLAILTKKDFIEQEADGIEKPEQRYKTQKSYKEKGPFESEAGKNIPPLKKGEKD